MSCSSEPSARGASDWQSSKSHWPVRATRRPRKSPVPCEPLARASLAARPSPRPLPPPAAEPAPQSARISMWGRLETCGRLGVPPGPGLPGRRTRVWLRLGCCVLLVLRIFAACDESKCGAGWKPAADWQSACPEMQTIWERFEPGVWLRLGCCVGQANVPNATHFSGWTLGWHGLQPVRSPVERPCRPVFAQRRAVDQSDPREEALV